MIDEREWMLLAIELARKCTTTEGRTDVPPKVGAVLVRDDVVIAQGYRSEQGRHAEFCVLDALIDPQLARGATLYSTLEPCSRRGNDKIACAQRIVDAGIARVVIGRYDPNPRIYRFGWKILRDAGVVLQDFPQDLREMIKADNHLFEAQYRHASGKEGSARFDYSQNAGKFDLLFEEIEFRTKWDGATKGIIYALDYKHNVAHARFAEKFVEIDDPSAYEFDNYVCSVKNGEIVIFRDGLGNHVLVRIVDVLSQGRGDDRTELSFEYQMRLRDART